jgi:hypothetical protein
MTGHTDRDRPTFEYTCLECGETLEDDTVAYEDHGQCYTVHPATGRFIVDLALPQGSLLNSMTDRYAATLVAKERHQEVHGL